MCSKLPAIKSTIVQALDAATYKINFALYINYLTSIIDILSTIFIQYLTPRLSMILQINENTDEYKTFAVKKIKNYLQTGQTPPPHRALT